MPRVSVIVPCYNSAWSVERTVASIIHQRFRDLEVIIIDDGSTDDLRQRIGPMMVSDDRIRLIKQDNRGIAHARNRGIAEAKGEFVAPIDADDLWHPDFLAETVKGLDENPDAPFAYAYTFRMDEQDRLLQLLDWRHPPTHDFPGLLSLNSVGSGSAAVFRRSAVLSIGGFDETMRERGGQGAEDWKLVLQLAAIATPLLIERHLVGYRLALNGMSQGDPRRQMQATLLVIADMRAQYPEIPARCFADARTMIIAWLLPAFIRKGWLRTALSEAFIGYVMNPLWFKNANVRMLHGARVFLWARFWAARIMGRPLQFEHLASVEWDGERPFRYLSQYTS